METEITVQSKVEEVIAKSGVAFELDLTQVASLAERGKAIVSVDDENFDSKKWRKMRRNGWCERLDWKLCQHEWKG